MIAKGGIPEYTWLLGTDLLSHPSLTFIGIVQQPDLLHCQQNKFTIYYGIPDGEIPSSRATIGGWVDSRLIKL